MIENRVLDLSVDSKIAFAYVLKFQDVSVDPQGNTTTTDIDITGATFKSSIKDSLDDDGRLITDIDIRVATPNAGIATMTITKDKVDILEKAAVKDREKYNPRIRFVGYYDVIMTMPNKTPIRILEGKVYINDGVTG
ncbi:hypothetical protein [Providencia phage PSTCR5]|uniref:LtfC/p132/Gp6 beta-sandwich domain-containing protein n=1 Tax=Providencia phage PSTCR5 TaxID=2783547 RepID=A0A873WTC6_9CAUD|nr:L-shaped tail fiber protein assembly [Providencia phage PSTCR5]QPB12124.1 hypothetical protein [Providencia phage PSTCR5]